MCAGERDLARSKHQYTMLKWDDGPSVLNNPVHKLTGKGELLRFRHQRIIFVWAVTGFCGMKLNI